jgi:hypothetical protein
MGMADYLSKMYFVSEKETFSYLHLDELTYDQVPEVQHGRHEDLELEANIALEDHFLNFSLGSYHVYDDDDFLSPTDGSDVNLENNEVLHPQPLNIIFMEAEKCIGVYDALGYY